MKIKIFTEAFKLIQQRRVQKSFENANSVYYEIKDYIFRIYLKTASWFSQCDCHAGVSNKPNKLCKHTIAGIVREFLIQNKLKLVDK